MIEVSGLSVSYGKGMPDVISGMSFNLDRGSVLNVLGQNAVGKTTLIRTLTRELRGYRGSARIAGREITDYSIRDYSRVVGVVSSSFSTYQNLLVADYLMTGFVNRLAQLSKPGGELAQKAFDVLEGFGKEGLFNKQIDQLSSGERQIVMIVRVLLQDPEVIIVDEPTANLDVRNQMAVLHEIKRLSSEGYTILVTSHNPGHARVMGGKTLIMGAGTYSFGDTFQVLREETLSRYYGLDVATRSVDGLECMVFRDGVRDGVELVF